MVLGALFLFLPPHKRVGESAPLYHKSYPKMHTASVSNLTLQSELDSAYDTTTYPRVYTGVTGCGSDPYMAQIYERESGCRTDAINPIGACGLGQALPCSKMGCSLSDWDCQNRFFVNYADSVYGSPAAAWAAWQSKGWW